MIPLILIPPGIFPYPQALVDGGSHPVLAVKAGRVSDFSGKSLGTISSSHLVINPDLPRAHQLAQWYTTGGGASMPVRALSNDPMGGGGGSGGRDPRKLIAMIKDEGLGRGGKADWISVRATITFIRGDNFCYAACPMMRDGRVCQKKVVREENNMYRCESCQKSMADCDFRYILNFQVRML